jgi:stage II sporulation protein D
MRRFIVISLLAVVVVATAQVATPAFAAAPRAFIVDGHGWGHGRGMGQYGARALAETGTPWFRILPRYYTGIAFKRQPVDASIRVLLVRAGAVVLKGDSKTAVRWATGKLAASSRSGRTYYRISSSRGVVVVDAGATRTGPWRRVAASRSTASVTARRQVGLVGASTVHWYRGAINMVPSNGGLEVIDNMSLERYVAEVVPREMPASWPVEALRAQAVAARTYATRVAQVARARHKSYDICGSNACQVFGGYALTRHGAYEVVESHRSNVAVQSTIGRIMTWHGKPILAEYSSSTGGYTASGGVPYLSPRPDPWDLSAPLHSWSDLIKASQIEARWPSVGSLKSMRVTGRDGRGDNGGRPQWVVISGSKGSLRVAASAFQYAFGLPSDWFRLTAAKGQYRFTVNLSYGTHNAAVHFLQERLRSDGFFPKTTPLSNYFGPITRAAVQRYQRAHHINPTGFLGPITRARLNASAS